MDRRRQLLLTQQSILKSRDGLLPFAQRMRPDVRRTEIDPCASTYEIAAHTQIIANELEGLERGDFHRLILSLPPRVGKTELASKTFVPWCAGRNPKWSFIVATYNNSFSGDFGRSIRGTMQDPRYHDVFPKAALKQGAASATRLETDLGAVFSFVGRGGTITGRGGDLIVVDDPIKDRVEADSQQVRETLWKWWTQVLSTRLMSDSGRILLIQTRWHEDDLIGRLTDPLNSCYRAEEAKRWRVVNLPALAEDDPENPDPLGRKPGEALWPGRFSAEYLEGVRLQDPRGFSALYQGSPTPGEGLFFSPSDVVEYHRMDEMPQDVIYYGASDHAISTNQWADKTVLMPFAVDLDDNIWIMPDVVMARAHADIIVEQMITLMKKYKTRHWWAERGHITKAIGPFLRKRMREENAYASIIELTPQFDKQARAQSIKGRMATGKVRFPSWAPWYQEAYAQMMGFPAVAKDDFVDTLSMVGMGLSLQMTPQTQVRKDTGPRYGTLGWLKAQSQRQDRHDRRKRANIGW